MKNSVYHLSFVIILIVFMAGCDLLNPDPEIINSVDTLYVHDTLVVQDTVGNINNAHLFYLITWISELEGSPKDPSIANIQIPFLAIDTLIVIKPDGQLTFEYLYPDSGNPSAIATISITTSGFKTYLNEITISQNGPLDMQHSTSIPITLYQYSSYIPLAIGNQWTFEVENRLGAEHRRLLTGIESWEIIDLTPDLSLATIRSVFTGYNITQDLYSGSQDSVVVTDYTSYFYFHFDDKYLGIITPPNFSIEFNSPLGFLYTCQTALSQKLLRVEYSYEMTDTLSRYQNCIEQIIAAPGVEVDATLIRNVGISYLDYEVCVAPGYVEHCKYELVEFVVAE
ncbi:MAG: hypothetical protein H8E26_00050 [FCB group bacterium]|nr:hypothetical protein [FCB group bacterium]